MIDSKAVTKASCRYAKLKPSVMLAIAEDIWVGNLRDGFFNSFDLETRISKTGNGGCRGWIRASSIHNIGFFLLLREAQSDISGRIDSDASRFPRPVCPLPRLESTLQFIQRSAGE